MKTSATGRALIAAFESEKLHGYLDAVNVPTIGYGHTEMAGGLINYLDGTTTSKVVIGAKITKDEADRLLDVDLRKFEVPLLRALRRKPSQDQFDAMVSLAFNIGSEAFKRSSVVRKFNAGDDDGAANAFLMWNKAGGKVLKGLTRRREAERALFLGRVAEASKFTGKPLPRYGDRIETPEPAHEARALPDVVQGKPATQSTTILAQAGTIATTVGTTAAAFSGVDWKTILAVGAVLTIGFALYTISERMRHSREDGI